MEKMPPATEGPKGRPPSNPAGYVPSVLQMLRPERSTLVELLGNLSGDQWSASTECPAWTVQGIARHLLGDDLSVLARQRDAATNGLVLYACDHPGLSFRQLLDGFNEQWVTAAAFLSPPLLTQMLSLTGDWTADHYESTDPHQLGEPVGMFGAAGASPYWQIAGREFVERWAHHHQIRRAVGAPRLDIEYDVGAANVIAATLAPAMTGIEAANGETATLEIEGLGSWNYKSARGAWTVTPNVSPCDGRRLVLEQEHAAAVLSRAFDRSQVFELIRPSNGDPTTTAIRTLLSVVLARP